MDRARASLCASEHRSSHVLWRRPSCGRCCRAWSWQRSHRPAVATLGPRSRSSGLTVSLTTSERRRGRVSRAVPVCRRGRRSRCRGGGSSRDRSIVGSPAPRSARRRRRPTDAAAPTPEPTFGDRRRRGSVPATTPTPSRESGARRSAGTNPSPWSSETSRGPAVARRRGRGLCRTARVAASGRHRSADEHERSARPSAVPSSGMR